MARKAAKSSAISMVELDQIRIDGGTQPRVAINQDVVRDYAEILQGEEELPSVMLYHDGADYWLADWFHRYWAAKRIGAEAISARVADGDLREAILYSVQANADHGLRRSNDDKRKAVKTLLSDPDWSKWSDREISRRCRVSPTLVGQVRDELASVNMDRCEPARKVKRAGKTYTQDTSQIGRKPAPEVSRTTGGEYEQLDPDEAAERQRAAVQLQTTDGGPSPALAAHVPERGLLVRLPRSSADLAQVLADLYTADVLEDLVARLTKILGDS